MKTVAVFAVLAVAGCLQGCLQSNFSGGSNASSGASASSGFGAKTSTGASATAAGGSPAGTTGDQFNTSSGNGPGGFGTTGDFGTSGGFGTGGFGTGGITGGNSGDTGGFGTAGQPTGGGVRATGTNGGTGGRRLSDAGPCQGNGIQCTNSDECCSGTCQGTCIEGAGEACFLNPDCVSYSCVNDICACSINNGQQSGYCGTSQDCCDQGACTFVDVNGYGYGLCCNDVGSGCQSPTDCCDGQCADGQCQCQAVGSYCYPMNDCCSGICNGQCLSGPGGPCSVDTDCTNANCSNGTTCGTCAGLTGDCSADDPCCSGLDCESRLVETGGSQLGVVDSGTACCAPSGASCQSGYYGQSTCCGECDAGTCECVGPTGACAFDQSCCTGGACMPGNEGLQCCQTLGSTCFNGFECCTDYCAPAGTCACMPDGGYYSSSPLGPAACCDGAGASDGTCL